MRLIRWLSARGLLVGTPESGAEPALLAATDPALGGGFVGPRGPGGVGGAASVQQPWAPVADPGTATRLWDVSEELTGVRVS